MMLIKNIMRELGRINKKPRTFCVFATKNTVLVIDCRYLT